MGERLECCAHGRDVRGHVGLGIPELEAGFLSREARLGAALCPAESEELETPDVASADFPYLRLRKDTYSPGSVTRKARKLARSGDVFVYFKHEDTPKGALRAEALLKSAITKK